jgi:hypothetical protein
MYLNETSSLGTVHTTQADMREQPRMAEDGRLWTPGSVDFFRTINEQARAPLAPHIPVHHAVHCCVAAWRTSSKCSTQRAGTNAVRYLPSNGSK